MANSWTLTAIVLLSIFMARSQTRVFKEQTFVPGNDVILQCGNATDIKWNELIYIVWNISLQGRKCWLGFNGLSPKLDDTCNDGKRLFNTSHGVSIVIPKISIQDEGFYSCDVSYKAGSYILNMSVSVTNVATQLDSENSQRIAVCHSIFKQKAPTLHWEPAINFSSNTSSVKKHGMFSMMENRVYLPANANNSELTCVATYTSESGSVQQKSTLNLTTGVSNQKSPFPWKIMAISVGSVCFILVFLAVVCTLRRKLSDLSALKMLCCKSKISTPAEDKPPQHTSVCMKPVDVEEVEPYASYIQRVNSIYNSSAELFNA
ncbi:cell surface glycoprotein CD200 receptor 1-A isoform X3 [Onychostoma macrolepis]|uniref:cell surface glycoprotein CD200 receptor 1-A isoform X3 n=1 Tax=Onychostoma macrolepis TaxID=369639 RepID=UPI00272972FF|nr:cell surface glycoprotein CD200 receptor 1-A isoform X3 [Onychostoma macrolepis]